MTDETKKLFDAPWKAESNKSGLFEVIDTSAFPNVATCYSEKDANRLVRLPELYDAMVETVYYKCFECMGGLRHNIDLTREELVKNGCPKQNKSNVCIYVKHIELLRKVRDGK